MSVSNPIERLTVTMPAEMAALIKDAVAGGDYASTSEVVREAVRDWKNKRTLQAEELTSLKADLDKGLADLAAGRTTAFDPAAFYRFATASLAHYAIPLFVRISSEIAMTSTFKLRKVELQQEGYDPMRCNGDPLYVADPDARTYMPLTDHALKRLEILPFGSNL